MNSKFLSLVVLFLILCLTAYAQQEKGDKVFRFNGSYSKYGNADGFAFLNLKAGYFINKNIEAGVEPTIILGGGFSQLSMGVYSTYNFITPDAKMVPYAGLRVSAALQSLKVPDGLGGTTSSSKGSGNLGLYGGLRYYITERVNLDSGISYDFGSINVFQWSIGIGVILGRR